SSTRSRRTTTRRCRASSSMRRRSMCSCFSPSTCSTWRSTRASGRRTSGRERTEAQAVTTVAVGLRPSARARARRMGRWLLANPVTTAGLAIIVLLVFVAVFAPVLAPFGPDELDPNNVLAPPSASHLFGTGVYGEDIFSRVLYGARYDLL